MQTNSSASDCVCFSVWFSECEFHSMVNRSRRCARQHNKSIYPTNGSEFFLDIVECIPWFGIMMAILWQRHCEPNTVRKLQSHISLMYLCLAKRKTFEFLKKRLKTKTPHWYIIQYFVFFSSLSLKSIFNSSDLRSRAVLRNFTHNVCYLFINFVLIIHKTTFVSRIWQILECEYLDCNCKSIHFTFHLYNGI